KVIIKNEKEKGIALRQIKKKKYYEKYTNKGNEIYLVGIEFDEEERNIVNFEWEKFEHLLLENSTKTKKFKI
ncbi:PD-(D/E)XK nuclease domain-containing protein, partial [Peptococcaceae bacterium]|nr:PD-(D/E)XK nuclease domain-containing protein [Peptococcaceae bacterium]